MHSLTQFRELAKRVDLFNKLSPDDVAKIYASGLTVHMQKDNVIFYQNTTGNTMYVVLGGRVDLFDGKKHITSLHEGDMFGEMALISEEPRSASAVAGEDTNLFVLSETTFHKLMTKRVAVQILLNIVGTLSKRLRESNKRYVRLREAQESPASPPK